MRYKITSEIYKFYVTRDEKLHDRTIYILSIKNLHRIQLYTPMFTLSCSLRLM